MIRVSPGKPFTKTLTWLDRLQRGDIYRELSQYGRRGVEALSAATPRDSGATAGAWKYGVEKRRGNFTIYWDNTNENDGSKIAILIQYGHGTGTGGYVTGVDYINPALSPVFDQILADIWRRVTNG